MLKISEKKTSKKKVHRIQKSPADEVSKEKSCEKVYKKVLRRKSSHFEYIFSRNLAIYKKMKYCN
ncbi:hypothetical protein Avbf_18750 [Armadillidium vulgare]|nr:hypothetical protein Avbf_18750 [Armadillidium vulgare]